MRYSLKSLCLMSAAFLISFITILIVLLRYPIMYGIDGPYYLIQMRHLLGDGSLKYPDPPLTYYMLAPFYLLFSDKNVGLKVAVAFYGGLTSLILSMAFRRFCDLSGLTASLTFTLSPFTLRLAEDFIKNYVSLIFPAIFIYILLNVKDLRRAAVYSSIIALASALSHVLTFGVLALLSLIVFISSLIGRGDDPIKYASASAAITSMIILTVSLSIFPQVTGYDSFKLLSFLNQPFGDGGGLTFRRIDFIGSMVIGLAGIIYGLTHRSEPGSLIPIASGISLILLNLPIIGRSWLFRFNLMGSILVPLIIASMMNGVEGSSRPAMLTAIIGLMFMVMLPTIFSLRPSITMNDYLELQRIVDYVPPGSTIVVPDTRLRYWVEALHEETYEIVRRPPHPPPQDLYLIVGRHHRPRVLPPRSKLILEGDYIQIIKLG
ncbi:MAG: hypothetical protein J7J28_01715 [Thaumarchaeota archaeon]|nr:hypothetical protein [Nitrososphaerota archaeon]